MPKHYNPVQLGLILDGLTRNEMLFDVAQGGSLHTVTTTGPRVCCGGSRSRIVQIHNKQEREGIQPEIFGSANGNRTRILALKGTTQCTGKLLKTNKITDYLHYRLDKLH